MLSRAEEALATERAYRSLPAAFGPQEEGLHVLGSMIDRPKKYQEKMLGQELSILAKLWAIAGSAQAEDIQGPLAHDLAVVDIGAGNGCLALLAALVLGGFAVLVDHTLPPPELRVEDKVPEQYRARIVRITADVATLDAAKDLEAQLLPHGIRRAVIIAKHLCGP